MIKYVGGFEDYLINKNLKPRTVEGYLYYLNKFTYLEFNQESVSKFLSKKQNRNTIARSFLLNFKRYLISNRKELKIDPFDYEDIIDMELPKITGRIKQRLIIPLTHSEVMLLEKYLASEKEKIQLLISYYGALRLGELFKIRLNSFNWNIWKDNKEGMGECRVLGKGDKEGICLIPPTLMFRIHKFIKDNSHYYSDQSSFIFMRETDRFESVTRKWQFKLDKAGTKSGLTQIDSQGNKLKSSSVHPHRLRHSFANHLLKDKKVDIRYIQEALRHSSIASTQIYTKVDISSLKKILEEANG